VREFEDAIAYSRLRPERNVAIVPRMQQVNGSLLSLALLALGGLLLRPAR
jgi:hypothetical protein